MNVSGTLMEIYRYLPYGERYAGTHTPHQYTGKERGAESGLDYFGARYLASGHGRWMSVDPVVGDLTDPRRLNRYSYVVDNPINLLDPDGAEPIESGCWENFYLVIYGERGDLTLWTYFKTNCGRHIYYRKAQEERGGGGSHQHTPDEEYLEDSIAKAKEMLQDEDCRQFVQSIIDQVAEESAAISFNSFIAGIDNAAFHFVKGPGDVSGGGTDVWRYFQDNPGAAALTETGFADVWIHYRRGVLLQGETVTGQIIVHEGLHLIFGYGENQVGGVGVTDTEIADFLGIEYGGDTPKERMQDASRKWNAELKEHCH